MNLPIVCIHRPVMTTLLMMAFVIFGLFGYRLLPVSGAAERRFSTIVVSATLPGAAPETMASSVADVLERQFSTISGPRFDHLDERRGRHHYHHAIRCCSATSTAPRSTCSRL